MARVPIAYCLLPQTLPHLFLMYQISSDSPLPPDPVALCPLDPEK